MIFQGELLDKVLSGEKTVTRRVCSENRASPWWAVACAIKPRKRINGADTWDPDLKVWRIEFALLERVSPPATEVAVRSPRAICEGLTG